jgi:hypothetical protein
MDKDNELNIGIVVVGSNSGKSSEEIKQWVMCDSPLESYRVTTSLTSMTRRVYRFVDMIIIFDCAASRLPIYLAGKYIALFYI